MSIEICVNCKNEIMLDTYTNVRDFICSDCQAQINETKASNAIATYNSKTKQIFNILAIMSFVLLVNLLLKVYCHSFTAEMFQYLCTVIIAILGGSLMYFII